MVTSVYVLLVPVNDIVTSTDPSVVYEKSKDVINPWNENLFNLRISRLNSDNLVAKDGYNFFYFVSITSSDNEPNNDDVEIRLVSAPVIIAEFGCSISILS